jgi:Fe-Mn family superoxide dismutase
LFFDLLTAESSKQPVGDLAKAIEATFSSFEEFKKQFSAAALGQFGSGWAWLCVNKEKKLIITATANQICPISQNMFPVLVIDVWEHAYYLKYRNKRVDFINEWWNLINWNHVEKLYQQALTTFDQ